MGFPCRRPMGHVDALEDAIREIELARDVLERPGVRTKLDSIAASLVEMIDTEAGELTPGEEAFADADFAGAAPSSDNLADLEGELAELAAEMDAEGRGHLEAARQRVADRRLHRRDGSRGEE